MRLVKVIAYITRQRPAARPDLLVFEHVHYPEAGTQVPAGTVKPGEELVEALLREVEEETGLKGLHIVGELAIYDWVHPQTGNTHQRHVYHLTAPDETAETWTWLETGGGEVSPDNGYLFRFRWAPLDDPPALAGGQGDFLHLLLRGES